MNPIALKFGFVGIGGGGSRIAHAFTLKGYPVCVINSANSDSGNLSLPDRKKLMLETNIDGAGKNIKIGEAIVTENQNKINYFLKLNFMGRIDYLILCIAGGGGTGTGSITPLINVCKILEIPVGVIYTIPMNSECNYSKSNCIFGLKTLNEFLQNKSISPVILIDNENLAQLFPALGILKFWQRANFEIVKTFDFFNNIPKRKSVYYSALDSMDYARIISSAGFLVFGKTDVTKYNNRLALTEAIQTSIENKLMCNGYDLSQSTAAGIIMIGSESVLDKLPAKSIDYTYDSIKDIVTQAAIFKGVYKDESVKDKLIIFSVFSGLGLPEQRIDELKEAAGLLKSQSNKRLAFDFGDNITTTEEDDEDPFLHILSNKRKKRL